MWLRWCHAHHWRLLVNGECGQQYRGRGLVGNEAKRSERKTGCRRTEAGERGEDRERQIWLLVGLEAGEHIWRFLAQAWQSSLVSLQRWRKEGIYWGWEVRVGVDGLQVQLIRAVYTPGGCMHGCKCMHLCIYLWRESSEAGKVE